MSENTTCSTSLCDRPADGWYVCTSCAETFTHTLADMGWLLGELDTVISQQTRYTTQSSGKGAETPLVFHVKASDTKARLVTELDTAARLIADANGWTLNYRTPTGCAAWLERSISAIRLHPVGGEIIDSVSSWYAGSMWVIDRPAQRQYLGDCGVTEDGEACPGRIYGKAGKPEARCDTCGATYQADAMRDMLLRQLDDRTCTAAEIARLSTYLGLPFDREQIRKRINQWHSRGQLNATNPREVTESKAARERGDDVPAIDPMFRFGDALALIHRHTEELVA